MHNILGDGSLKYIFGKREASTATREYVLAVQGSLSQVQIFVFSTTSAFDLFTLDSTGLHSDADPGWDILFVGRRSTPSHQIICRINDGSIQTFRLCLNR